MNFEFNLAESGHTMSTVACLPIIFIKGGFPFGAKCWAIIFFWNTNSQAEQISLAAVDSTHFSKRKRSQKIDQYATFCTEWKWNHRAYFSTFQILPKLLQVLPVISTELSSPLMQLLFSLFLYFSKFSSWLDLDWHVLLQSHSPSLRSLGRNVRLWDNPLPEAGNPG
jgi:hypothetical protein